MLRLRKDSIMRRSSSSASVPPTVPVEAKAQVPSPSKTDKHDKHDKHEDNNAASGPAHPHGFKALSRRVSHSKPVRILKGITSRSSLRRSSSEVVPTAQRRVSSESAASLATSAASAERSMKEDPVREEGGLNTYSKEVAAAQTQTQTQTQTQAAVEVTPEVESAPEQAGEREAERTLVPVVPEQTTAEDSDVVHEAQNINKEVVPTEQSTQESEEPSISTSQEAVATSDAPAVAAVTDASSATPETKATDVTENVTEEVTAVPSTEEHHVTVQAGHERVDSDDLSLSSTSTSVDPSPALISDSFVIVKVNKSNMDEPEINPFILDDPAEALSDSGKSESTEAAKTEESGVASPPEQSVVLSQTESITLPTAQEEPASTAPRPPAPPASSPAPASEGASSEEETAPELHAPALTLSTLFLPVPNVRRLVRTCFSLTWWLTAKAASYPLSYVPSSLSSSFAGIHHQFLRPTSASPGSPSNRLTR